MEGVGNVFAEEIAFHGEDLCSRNGHSMAATRYITLVLWCFLVGVTLTSRLAFALEPALQSGLDWFQGQVQADGSLASESNSVATPFQARTETAYALRDLASVPAALTDAIQADVVSNNEYASRRLLVLEGTSSGRDLLDELGSSQNPDGGFGGTFLYQSNPLDTAYALMAANVMAGKGFDVSQIVSRGLAYLAGSQSTDGSWVPDSQANIFVTSAVLFAVQEWYSVYSVSSMTSKAADWLLSNRTAGVYADVMDAAEALIALTGQTNATDVIGPLADQLRTAQGSDGAWLDDPYVTALALRALWAASQPPPAVSATGGISGRVVDAADSSAISQAALQLVENTNFITASTSDGSFILSGVTPGTYTLRVSKLGYEARQFVVTVTAGEVVTFSDIAINAQALTASLSGVVKTNSGTALSDAVVAVGTVSTVTGSTGAYSLTGLSPGTATVTVTKSGYLTAAAAVDFSAGHAYTFSPTLYTSNAPTTATLRGKLTDAMNGAAIAGGIVTVGGMNITTATDGSFEYTGLAAGAFSLAAVASGYQDYGVAGSLSLGINDIGTLSMQRLPTVSTLSGSVTDAQSRLPVANAQLTLQGTAQSAVSAADGTYSLANVSATSLVVNVSASGYQSASFNLTVTQPGDITADFPLLVLQPSGIAFSEIKTDKDYYAPSDKLAVNVTVSNSSTTAADLVIEAQVLDALNNVSFEMPANATGLGVNPPNLPLTITAASSNDFELSHSMIREAGGQHTVLVRAHDASGNVVAEGKVAFVVLDEALLGGGLVVSPPLAQAGTDIPVNFTAQLGNFGNLPIESATVQLVVTLDHPDTSLSTQPETSVSQITNNSLLSPSKSLARDSSGNLYTVKSGYNDGRILRIDAAGNTSVFATMPNTNGPPYLADVIVDAGDNVWAADIYGKVWKITQSGVITELKIAGLSYLTGFDVNSSGDIFTSGTSKNTGQQVLVKHDTAGVETVLWSNGLNTPVGIASDGAGGYVVSNSGDGTLVKLSAGGTITPFVSGLSSPKGVVDDGAGNYFVVNSGNGSVVRVASDGTISTLASGLPQPAGIALSGSGDLYVTTWGDRAVYRVSQGGSAELYARGLASRPQGMKYDSSGNLYIADDFGVLTKKDATGQVSVLATTLGSTRGVDVTSAGDVFVASYSAGSVVKVSGTDKTNFVTGLSNPNGLAVSPAGDVWVTEQSKHRIDRFAGDGSLLERIESPLYNPNDLAIAPDGRLWVCNSNAIALVESNAPSKWSTGRTYNKIAYDSTSGDLVATSGYDLYRIDSTGTAVKVLTLTAYPYGIAVDPSGNIVISSGTTIQKLDSAGGLTELATFPSNVQSLSGDGTGRYFVTAGYKLYRVETDFSVTSISVIGTELAYWVKVGADGQLLVWTNYGRLYRVNPDTGDFVQVSGIGSITSAISDAAGNINATVLNQHQLSRYDSSGVLLNRITGFIGPKGIVWYGNEARFIDGAGRMFSVVPGQVPALIGGALNAAFLAVRGTDLFATSGSGVYQWNGNGWTLAKTIPNLYYLNGIAVRPDGALTIDDHQYSRVVTLDGSSFATLEDYGGLTMPWGIAVASDGTVYVADYASSTIGRLGSMGEAPSFVAKTSSPGYLTIEPTGTILVSHNGYIDRLDPATDSVTTLPGLSARPQQTLVDGSGILAVDSLGRVFKLENDTWSLLASGINNTRALRVQNDQVFVLNGNGVVSVYQSGNLDVLADTGIAHPRSLARSTSGWLAGGDGGALAMVDQSGAVTPINIASLIQNKPILGLYELSSENTALLADNGSSYSLNQLTITQPQDPPAAGTVVYTASLPVASLPAGDSLASFDFGSWVPPYGGDFRAEVMVPGVMGKASNLLYVGPNAQGVLSTASDEQAPADQTVPFNLNVTGADYISLSKVETGLIRPLTAISRPYGMVGDKSGNLWYTDSTHLYRKTASGVHDTIVSGLALAYGLSVDSQERFYVASKNVGTGTYDLLRIATDGTVETVADLGVTRVNGVGVNSRDEVFIGSPNNLLKVDPVTGSVSTFTTIGLANPRNIAIDGKDNIYVQNESNIISMIKPDQSSVLLYSKGDGTIDPIFEGDGYPNIAADCSDNLYTAPDVWKKIGQNGEEHVLAQVVQHTGQASALFDGLQISSRLRDIDYLAFDRFGSRLLLWVDSYREIWQVPVTCGAISVEAHLVAQTGQTLSGFNRPPSAVVPLTDGRTEYVFSLRDVTAQGASISGETTLTGLLLDENRPVMDSAYLQFQNSFAPQQVQLPLNVPNVHVRNLVNLTVSTDKPEYAAGDTAQISGALTNQNADPVSGDLHVDIEDAAGVSVGPVIQQPATMGAGGSITFNNGYAVGTIVPGKYDAVARLYENGEVVSVARTGFKVLADHEQATADSRLSLDRQAYAPSDRLIISSRASNRSLNVVLENLRLLIRVLDPTGVVLQSQEYPILQLAPGLSQSFSTSYAYRNAAPGTYHVEQTLMDADERSFDQHVVNYTVQSSADTGYGLTGSIMLSTHEYAVGDSVPVLFGVNNTGNADVSGLPLTLAIVNPDTQEVIAQYPYTADIAVGNIYTNSSTWMASGQGGEYFAVILQAESGGNTLNLAQDVIHIKADVVHLELFNRFGNDERLLVLAGCGKNVEQGKTRQDIELEAAQGNLEQQHGNDQYCVHDSEPDCSLERAASIDTLLNGLSISHYVTNDPAVFRNELRSGLYNGYWVSGKVQNLDDTLGAEIREAAFRGDGVLLDGLHDESTKTLEEIGGVLIHGKLRARDQAVSLMAPFQDAYLTTLGRGLKLVPTTAQIVGRFGLAAGDPPAVTTDDYGYGHSMLYGFDLIRSLGSAATEWTNAFGQSLIWAAPAFTGAQAVGEAVQFQMEVSNLSVGTDVGVRLTLPAGAVYLSSDTAPESIPVTGNTEVSWSVFLAKDETRTINVMVRLPETAGMYAFVTETGAIKNGVYQRFGDPVNSFVSLTSALQSLSATIEAINQLPITLAKEKAFRNQSITLIEDAQSSVTDGQYGAAIDNLVAGIDKLKQISTAETKDVRYQIDLAIKGAEWQWRKTQ